MCGEGDLNGHPGHEFREMVGVGGRSSESAAAGAEEGAEELATSLGFDAGHDIDTMVEHGAVEHMEVVVDRAGFGIGRPVDNELKAGVDHGARAHRAGFERHIHGAVMEAPRPDLGGGVTQCEYFSMSHRIASEFAFVVACCDHAALMNDDDAHRDVVVSLSGLGLLDRELHPRNVRRTRCI